MLTALAVKAPFRGLGVNAEKHHKSLMEITKNENHFILLPQRAIYWREQSALILSDMHIGKTGHFRKEGIPLPDDPFHTDLNTLDVLVQKWQPRQLIVVGDMFHSRHNKEIDRFALWRASQTQLVIHLIKGNHDILPSAKYEELNIQVSDTCTIGHFLFSHKPIETDLFCFSGHIHPGVRLSGAGRQSLKFPCFHFSKNACTLPAFSLFTGLSIINCEEDHSVYAIVGDEVIEC